MFDTSNKNQKILIQIGLDIIVLFTIVIIAVGNMVTMSSFSTSGPSRVKLNTVSNGLGIYQ